MHCVRYETKKEEEEKKVKWCHLNRFIPFAHPMLVSENCEHVSVTHRISGPSNVTYTDTSLRLKYMTECFYNARSHGSSERQSKSELFVCGESVDVLMLTETWLRCQGDETKRVDTTAAAYTMRSLPVPHGERVRSSSCVKESPTTQR